VPRIPDKSIDLILSDIPYGIGFDHWDILHNNTNTAYQGASSAQKNTDVFRRRGKPINGWSKADHKIGHEYRKWCDLWSRGWLRVLKPGGSAVVMCGRRYAHQCITAMTNAGFNFRDMIAWIRPSAVFKAQRLSLVFRRRGFIGEANKWSGWRIGNLSPRFEPVLWFFKPYAHTIADNMLDYHLGALNIDAYRSITGTTDNIVTCDFKRKERGYHPNQKPVSLMSAFILLCTQPNQTVLDPFAGSGSTAVAAK